MSDLNSPNHYSRASTLKKLAFLVIWLGCFLPALWFGYKALIAGAWIPAAILALALFIVTLALWKIGARLFSQLADPGLSPSPDMPGEQSRARLAKLIPVLFLTLFLIISLFLCYRLATQEPPAFAPMLISAGMALFACFMLIKLHRNKGQSGKRGSTHRWHFDEPER